MSNITASQLIELFSGEKIRKDIRSQSPDVQRKIIVKLKNLLADVSPDTQPSSRLYRYFSEHEKPRYRHRSDTGCAPDKTRWICPLCPNKKQIKTRTNDLRRHLEKEHECEKAELRRVFNPKDPERLWEYFGPCTEEDAAKNHWEVTSFETRKRKSKSTPAAIAGAGVKAISKGVQSFKTMGKRKNTTTEEELESSLESLTISEQPEAVECNTEFGGSTVVPQNTDTSSNTGTFYSFQHDVNRSPQTYPTDTPREMRERNPMADSVELGALFETDSLPISAGPLPPMNMIPDYWAPQNPEGYITRQQSDLIMLDQAEVPSQTSNTTPQNERDYYDYDMVEDGDFEKETFPYLFNQEYQQKRPKV